jgi:hypothetical protein
MNYLGRPIFPFAINWDDAVSRSVSYNLRETLLGFGAEFYVPTATYTAMGWQCHVVLETATDILAWESFCDGLVGRVNGFWLPCPIEAAEFLAGISFTQFDIVGEDLASSWQRRPDQHLLLIYPNGTERVAQIADVETSAAGERITLTAALPEVPPAGTVVRRLHYVRFAEDEESAEMAAGCLQDQAVSVVELPLEYAQAQTGLAPIYLYHLWAKTPVNTHWRCTSFAAPVVSNDEVYTPWPMQHGAIKRGLEGESDEVEIDAKQGDEHPFKLIAEHLPPGRPLMVEILRCDFATPDAVTKMFSGYVASVADDGIQYTAKCKDRLAWLKTKAPGFTIGSSCNNELFDPRTCKVSRWMYQVGAIISAFSNGVGVNRVPADATYDVDGLYRKQYSVPGLEHGCAYTVQVGSNGLSVRAEGSGWGDGGQFIYTGGEVIFDSALGVALGDPVTGGLWQATPNGPGRGVELRLTLLYGMGTRWQATDWFRGGMLQVGSGTDYELRTILRSSWTGQLIVLRLNAPLFNSEVGGECLLLPGCDHTAETCKAKYGAFGRFSGFIAVPNKNLTLSAINASTAQGGKK